MSLLLAHNLFCFCLLRASFQVRLLYWTQCQASHFPYCNICLSGSQYPNSVFPEEQCFGASQQVCRCCFFSRNVSGQMRLTASSPCFLLLINQIWASASAINTNASLLNETGGQRGLCILSVQHVRRHQNAGLWPCAIWPLNAIARDASPISRSPSSTSASVPNVCPYISMYEHQLQYTDSWEIAEKPMKDFMWDFIDLNSCCLPNRLFTPLFRTPRA